MYDTRLVTAAQQGDEAAFAALYDRNVDAVFDFCRALTGDDAEASRLVADTFVLAARHIDEVVDASQVRPWLLAIARDRILTEDEAGTLQLGWTYPFAPVGPGDEPLSLTDLRRWVRLAASVLALADQAVVELAWRHDLDAEQLAATIGCDPGRLASVMDEVEQDAGHVLGALVLARQGRRDCPALAALLVDWDGTPSVEVAETVDAHAQVCERCSRRLQVANPLELLAAAPAEVPPAELRNRVLDRTSAELARLVPPAPPAAATAAAAGAGLASGRPRATLPEPLTSTPTINSPGYGAPADGGPGQVPGGYAAAAAGYAAAGPATQATHVTQSTQMMHGKPVVRSSPATFGDNGLPPWRQPWVLAGAAAAAVLILIVIGFLVLRSSGPTKVISGPSTTGISAPTTTVAASAGTIVAVDSTTTSTSTTTAPQSRLQLNAASVNLGSAATSARVTLSNAGNSPATWRAVTGVSWLTASPSSGYLQPNATVSVSLLLDRQQAPVGSFDVPVTFSASDAGSPRASLHVIGTNQAPTTTAPTTTSTTAGTGPTITSVGANPTTVQASPCPTDRTTITATVSDTAKVSSVAVAYSLPDGHGGTTPMTQSGNQWTATVGGSTKTGTIYYQVTATDETGMNAVSPRGSVTVASCPL